MRSFAVVKAGGTVVALVLGLMAGGSRLAAQEPVIDRVALVAPVRAAVSTDPVVAAARRDAVADSPAAGARAIRGSAGRSVARGALVGALVGAAGGVAMGAFVCNQGFGCSDRGAGITYWTLSGAGAGAVLGWVLHAVRSDG